MNFCVLIRCFFLFAGLSFVGCSPALKPPSQKIAYQNQKKQVLERKGPPFKEEKFRTLIVIDPGHGGEDYGTNAKALPQYQEKTFNLTCSSFLKKDLEDLGYLVLMTRSIDIFVPLMKRAEIANKKKSALFVSVHFNAALSSKAEGIEIFYFKSDQDKKRSGASKHLAQKVLDEMLTLTKAKSRGVKEGNFAVIRETKMPAILVEGGFLSNQKEFEKIKKSTYLRSLARGIALGIDGYLKSVPGAS